MIASIFFLVSLSNFGMLPSKYLLLLTIFLAVLVLGFVFMELKLSKGKLILNGVSLIVSVALIAGAGFINQTTGTVQKITGNGSEQMTQINHVVVAVLAENPAETLSDLADDTFGVQYTLKGEEIKKAVNQIQKDLEREVKTIEYENIQEQVQALYDKEVSVIIFDEAYIGVLEYEFEDIQKRLKIIDTKKVEKQVQIPIKQEEEKDDNCFIVYISGIDVYGSIRKTSRSDVNILAAVNPDTHQVLLINTPRDYFIEFPGVTGGKKDKLTHAGIYGVDVSMAALGTLYDIDPEYYVRVNFTSLIEMVDALGGVDVYSEYAFVAHKSDYGEVNVSKGMNHFDGEEALAFSRARKNVPGGDFQRGKNQQAVITAMIQKVISPAILLGANDIMASLAGNIDTNMSRELITELLKEQLDQPVPWDVKSIAAEGTGGSERCYSMPGRMLYVTYPDYESVDAIKEAIAQVRAGEALE